MTYTYGDVKVGDLIDSDLVETTYKFWAGPWGGPHVDYVRITTKSGGIRTELASHPAGSTDRELDSINDEDLNWAADTYGDALKNGTTPSAKEWKAILLSLHGVAVEMNRRQA